MEPTMETIMKTLNPRQSCVIFTQIFVDKVNCNEVQLDLEDESNRTYLGRKSIHGENAFAKISSHI